MSTDATEPRAEPPIRPKRATARSVVIVNTGHGKGKTTAAMGTLIRAVARGWNVCVVQFIKSGKWRVGEAQIAKQLGVDWWTLGDGFSWESRDLDESEALRDLLGMLPGRRFLRATTIWLSSMRSPTR